MNLSQRVQLSVPPRTLGLRLLSFTLCRSPDPKPYRGSAFPGWREIEPPHLTRDFGRWHSSQLGTGEKDLPSAKARGEGRPSGHEGANALRKEHPLVGL